MNSRTPSINRLDDWLFDQIRPYVGRRLLEIGCGHGNFAGRFLDLDLDPVVATDVDAGSVSIVQKQYGSDSRFHCRQHDICAPVDTELAAYAFDTVFSLNPLFADWKHVCDRRSGSLFWRLPFEVLVTLLSTIKLEAELSAYPSLVLTDPQN